jgi:hypothetical protein
MKKGYLPFPVLLSIVLQLLTRTIRQEKETKGIKNVKGKKSKYPYFHIIQPYIYKKDSTKKKTLNSDKHFWQNSRQK